MNNHIKPSEGSVRQMNLKRMNQCPFCGAKLKGKSIKCPKCGKIIVVKS